MAARSGFGLPGSVGILAMLTHAHPAAKDHDLDSKVLAGLVAGLLLAGLLYLNFSYEGPGGIKQLEWVAEGSGHFVPLERPEWVQAIVLELLATLDGADEPPPRP